MGVAARNDHVERTAALLLRFGPDHAVVHLDDAFCQRKPDAGSQALDLRNPVEGVEDALQVADIHADAVVREREVQVTRGAGIELRAVL